MMMGNLERREPSLLAASRTSNYDMVKRILESRSGMTKRRPLKRRNTGLTIRSTEINNLGGTVNINYQDKYGNTSLYWSCRMGNVDITRTLLAEPDIDPNLSTESRPTPLGISCQEEGHIDCVKLLLQHPAIDPNIGGMNGAVPLITASRYGQDQVFKLLLTHPKTDPNAGGLRGASPLISTCRSENLQCTRFLLDHPLTDIDYQDNQAKTALMWASQLGYRDIVKLLLQRGADWELRNVWDQTALSLAEWNKHSDTVHLIQRFMIIDKWKAAVPRKETSKPRECEKNEEFEERIENRKFNRLWYEAAVGGRMEELKLMMRNVVTLTLAAAEFSHRAAEKNGVATKSITEQVLQMKRTEEQMKDPEENIDVMVT